MFQMGPKALTAQWGEGEWGDKLKVSQQRSRMAGNRTPGSWPCKNGLFSHFMLLLSKDRAATPRTRAQRGPLIGNPRPGNSLASPTISFSIYKGGKARTSVIS